MNANDCCILNAGGGSWAFAPLAEQLSEALWVDIAEEPRRFSYLLLAGDAAARCRLTRRRTRAVAAERYYTSSGRRRGRGQ